MKHPSRLDRDGGKRFATLATPGEELVDELWALLSCAPVVGFDELLTFFRFPELQARGFRREYEGTTLRDHFGLPRVPAPAR